MSAIDAELSNRADVADDSVSGIGNRRSTSAVVSSIAEISGFSLTRVGAVVTGSASSALSLGHQTGLVGEGASGTGPLVGSLGSVDAVVTSRANDGISDIVEASAVVSRGAGLARRLTLDILVGSWRAGNGFGGAGHAVVADGADV